MAYHGIGATDYGSVISGAGSAISSVITASRTASLPDSLYAQVTHQNTSPIGGSSSSSTLPSGGASVAPVLIIGGIAVVGILLAVMLLKR